MVVGSDLGLRRTDMDSMAVDLTAIRTALSSIEEALQEARRHGRRSGAVAWGRQRHRLAGGTVEEAAARQGPSPPRGIALWTA
jgi:hypothetical protein